MRIGQEKKINLVVFFTYGKSLKKWNEMGLLDRELKLYKKLLNKDIKVTFITYEDKSEFEFQSELEKIELIPVYSIFKRWNSKLLNFLNSFLIPFRLKQIFKETQIIKANQMWGAWVPILVKILFGNKFILRCGYELYSNSPANMFFGKRWLIFCLSAVSYHYSDKVVLTSNSMADFVVNYFKVPYKKISICQNYVDIDKFKCTKKFFSASNRVLFIGRLTREKNLDLLVRACKKASIGMSLVGTGPMMEYLKETAFKLGVDTRFYGVVPNQKLPSLINNYRIFVFVSLFEWNPKALLEAMACGRAVIGVKIRGIQDVIRHGENGILCESSEESISKAIMYFANNPAYAWKLGKEARKSIVANNSLESAIQKEMNVYREVLHC